MLRAGHRHKSLNRQDRNDRHIDPSISGKRQFLDDYGEQMVTQDLPFSDPFRDSSRASDEEFDENNFIALLISLHGHLDPVFGMVVVYGLFLLVCNFVPERSDGWNSVALFHVIYICFAVARCLYQEWNMKSLLLVDFWAFAVSGVVLTILRGSIKRDFGLVPVTSCLAFLDFAVRMREFSLETVAISLLFALVDLHIRNASVLAVLSSSPTNIVVTCSLAVFIGTNFSSIYRFAVYLRNYRAVVDHLDWVYGQMRISPEFIRQLRIAKFPAGTASNSRISSILSWLNAFFLGGKLCAKLKHAHRSHDAVQLPHDVISFSNSQREADRLELCIESVEHNCVAVSWSTPRSLLLDFSRPDSILDETASLFSEIFNCRLPSACIKLASDAKSNKENAPIKCVEIEGEFGVISTDILILLNGKPVESDFDIDLPRKIIKVAALKPAHIYTLQVSLSGYRSLMVQFKTNKAPELTNDPVYTESQELMQRHFSRRVELMNAIDEERSLKKTALLALKKLRKDGPKTCGNLKNELMQLKKLLGKEEAQQARVVNRIAALTDGIKSAEKAIINHKREIETTISCNEQVKLELSEISHVWFEEKSAYEAVENELRAQEELFEKGMSDVGDRMSKLTVLAGTQQEQLYQLDEETRTMNSTVSTLDDQVKRERKELIQLEKRVREERKLVEKLQAGADSQKAMLEESLKSLAKENAALQQHLYQDRKEVAALEEALCKTNK